MQIKILNYKQAITQKIKDKKKEIKKSKKIIIKDEIEKCLLLTKENIDIPENNKSIHYLTAGKIQICDIIEILINQMEIIQEMNISVLSYTIAEIQKLLNYYDEGKIKIFYIIRCRFFEDEKKEKYNFINKELEKREIKETVVNTHAKIYIFTDNKNYIIIESSQNLTIMNCCEQITVYNNKNLYDFYKSFFDEIRST